jgi:hypothetical protein
MHTLTGNDAATLILSVRQHAAMDRSFVKNAGHDDAAGRAGHGA